MLNNELCVYYLGVPMLKDVIKSVAPFIGGLLGGPVGAAATKKISDILLPGNQNPSVEELETALINANPDQVAKIKELDYAYKVNIESIHHEDRKDARRREVATKDWMPAIITIAVMCGFFSVVFLLFFDSIAPKNSEIIDLLIGSLSTVFIQTITYYFGSSKDSKK